VPWLVDNGHWVWLGTLLLMAAMLARNTLARYGWRQAPWLVALLGTLLNIVVIVVNGGYMPVDSAALAASGATAELAERPRYRRDVAISDATRLPLLADVLVGPAWLPRGGVISIGDVLLVGGLGWWLMQVALTTPRARPVVATA